MASITDGTSNTIFVGERTTRTRMTSGSARGTFWADSFNLYTKSASYPYSAILLNDFDKCASLVPNDNYCKYGWGSFHSGGINFLYADGHVGTVQAGIDQTIFAALGTVAGGEVVPGNF